MEEDNSIPEIKPSLIDMIRGAFIRVRDKFPHIASALEELYNEQAKIREDLEELKNAIYKDVSQ